MRELVFLLEEPSASELLKIIVPQIIGDTYFTRYIVFDGKQDLEKRLTFKLKYYCNPDAVFIVMRDQDSGNCIKIKNELQKKCEESGKPYFVIRIACHELETFYLADLAAVDKAFGISVAKLQNKQKYRNPDNLTNAKEELQKLCPSYSEITGSKKIASFMDISNTRSLSFYHLIQGIKKITGTVLRGNTMVWLIGSKGMLASEIAAQLDAHAIQWIGSDKEVDITDRTSVEAFAQRNFKSDSLQWIINCAAYTAVDKAEDDPVTAQNLNADALINICEIAKQYGAQLIHFSTDYVFDGTSAAPYTESDNTHPQSVYGATKLQGEQNIVERLSEYYIIRTAWLYGKNGNNFVSTMLRLMNEKNSLKVVNDQRGSPTYAVDLAKAVLRIIQQDNHRYGIYHYSNEGNITWYDFASEIYKQGKNLGLIKSDCVVGSCASNEFPQKAHRPSFSLLNKEKIKTAFSLSIPLWNESLTTYLKELL